MCFQVCGDISILIHCLREHKMVQSLSKTVWLAFPQKVKRKMDKGLNRYLSKED